MMRVNRRYLPAVLIAAFLVSGTPFAQSSVSLRAGAARVDITPEPSELEFSTDSIRGRLYVRAIVVDDGRSCAAIVGVDAGGLGNTVVDRAIAQSSASTRCPASNYVISATHTHSGSTGPLGGPGAPTQETITAAIVAAIDRAKTALAPARVGFGTAELDLNVNRDLFNDELEWRQGPNPAGVSDKTLAVLEFVGLDAIPIGVVMNYGMHPINYYLSGVVSADFPGEASKYVEDLFDGRTVAIFTQAASGDQNPRLGYSAPYSLRSFRRDEAPPPLTVGPVPPPPENATQQGFNAAAAAAGRHAIPPQLLSSYRKVLGRIDDYVTMLGHMIGSTAFRVMREDIEPVGAARIWSGERTLTCPGRVRLDVENPARENVFPGYADGPDINIKVGLLRIGDINLVRVNGEIYTNILSKLKTASPANRTMAVTLANGFANSGYIYSDDAYTHLTFQVIGSRLKPGCAEDGIVATALGLMEVSGL